MKPMHEQIRETRKARGMTQSELAVAADVGEATIRRIERGDSPSMDSLESVARALGLSVALVTAPDAASPAPAAAVSGDEPPANADAPVAVSAGAVNTGGHEGALNQE